MCSRTADHWSWSATHPCGKGAVADPFLSLGRPKGSGGVCLGIDSDTGRECRGAMTARPSYVVVNRTGVSLIVQSGCLYGALLAKFAMLSRMSMI